MEYLVSIMLIKKYKCNIGFNIFFNTYYGINWNGSK